MTGNITFNGSQTFPVSGIQNATTGQKGVVQIGTNIQVTAGVISVNAATTSVVGVVQLTDSTSSTSTTTAATPNSVKTAYDLAVTANNNATAAQATASGAIPKATFTAAGQLLYSTGNGTYAVLPPGNPGEVLQCNGSAPPTWVLPAVVNYSKIGRAHV